jgi:hypothetical protein
MSANWTRNVIAASSIARQDGPSVHPTLPAIWICACVPGRVSTVVTDERFEKLPDGRVLTPEFAVRTAL